MAADDPFRRPTELEAARIALGRLRQEAALSEQAASVVHDEVARLWSHGQTRQAVAMERLAMARDRAAERLRLRAAALAADLHLRAGIAAVVTPFAR